MSDTRVDMRANAHTGPRADTRALRVLEGMAFAALALLVLSFVGVVALRSRHPFELEWMEGGMLAHVGRVLRGQPVYAAPDLDFVSFLYPPLYYYAAAALSWLVGEGFGPLRALSIASAVASFGLLYRIVWRESHSRAGAAVAAGLLVASYERSGAWFDLARNDSFSLLWLLLVVERLRAARTPANAALAGLALAAAFFVKQSVVVVAAPLALACWWIDRRQALLFAATAAAAAAVGVLALDLSSGGWFSYYTLWLPRHHPVEAGRSLSFWLHDIGAVFGVAFAAVVADQVWRLRRAGRELRDAWFWPALLAGGLAASWSVRLAVGAHLNNLIPAYAVLSLGAGLAYADGRRLAARAGGARAALLPAALLLQLGLLAYDPRPLVPTARDRAAGEALVARIAALPGDVFIPNHGYLARRAGKRAFAHTLAIDNLLVEDRGPARQRLERLFLQGFAEHRYGAVILDSDGRYAEFARHFYGEGVPLFDEDSEVFLPVSGGRIRPQTLYRRP